MDSIFNRIKSFLYKTFRIILWTILGILVFTAAFAITKNETAVCFSCLLFAALPIFLLVKTKKKNKQVYNESVNSEKTSSKNYKRVEILDFLSNYTLLDLETTGLSADIDEIIEVSAIRVRNNQIVDTFSSLVRPSSFDIPAKIVELTGINANMLKKAPEKTEVLNVFINFIGDDVLVGYNTPFDLGFLDENILNPPDNNYVDILSLVKKILPKIPKKSLESVCEYFDIDNENAHRGLVDCERTKAVYECLKDTVEKNYGSVDTFVKAIRRGTPLGLSKSYYDVRPVSDFVPKNYDFDKTHPAFGMYFVFTGELEKMDRNTAMQKVVDLGGYLNSSVCKKTNYLVCGSIEGNRFVKGRKTSKREKAETMIAEGANIKILTEKKFYDMIDFKN